jgi:hypothetical protein
MNEIGLSLLACYVIGFVTGFVWGWQKELGLEE